MKEEAATQEAASEETVVTEKAATEEATIKSAVAEEAVAEEAAKEVEKPAKTVSNTPEGVVSAPQHSLLALSSLSHR